LKLLLLKSLNHEIMALELSGKVVAILQEQTGTGKNGVWVRQDFVVETSEQYPKKICFSAWGDKAAIVKNLTPGTSVKVAFNAESREYNGRWYTDLRTWKIETQGLNATSNTDIPLPDDNSQFINNPAEDIGDDLPF
jgi:hypothetical protein